MDLNFTSLSSAIVGSVTTAGAHAQAVGAVAAASAQALPTAVAGATQALPSAVNAGMAGTHALHQNLTLVEKPVAAAARGTGLSTLGKLARGLSRTLPWVAIGSSAITGARAIEGGGMSALATTKKGRGAVLGAVGGVLLLTPTPPTQIAASVVLAGIAANEFGAFRRFDRPQPVAAPARPV